MGSALRSPQCPECGDLTRELRIAREFSESVRLKNCGEKAPAFSATCNDFSENIRWALIESASCGPFARQLVEMGVTADTEPLHVRAEWIRRGFEVAQGHNMPVARSSTFIADALILRIATNIYKTFNVGNLNILSIDDPEPDDTTLPR
jgi:hypothetical protein